MNRKRYQYAHAPLFCILSVFFITLPFSSFADVVDIWKYTTIPWTGTYTSLSEAEAALRAYSPSYFHLELKQTESSSNGLYLYYEANSAPEQPEQTPWEYRQSGYSPFGIHSAENRAVSEFIANSSLATNQCGGHDAPSPETPWVKHISGWRYNPQLGDEFSSDEIRIYKVKFKYGWFKNSPQKNCTLESKATFLVHRNRIVSCPVGYVLKPSEGGCVTEASGIIVATATACDCDENLEGSQCVQMEKQYSIEYELNGAKLYQYTTNNQGQRCPPVDYDELDGCKTNTGVGNPIDCATGQKVQVETDYQGAGADPLRYTRVYQSPLSDDPDGDPVSGLPWLNASKPALSLQTLSDGARLGIFTIGHKVERVLFNVSGGSDWSSNPYMDPIGMGTTGGGRSVTYNGKVYRLNTSGQTQATEENGIERYTYHYDDDGKLAEIRNRFGAFLQFTYDDDNRLIRLTDQAESEIYYTYDNHGNLSEVIYPDETPGNLSDNPRKRYLYENNAFPYHLTGVIDESGLQFARFDYDANGRGILTEHANGAGRVTINYPEEGRAIVRFYRDTNTDAYREEVYTYDKFRGAYRLTSRTVQVCEDCTLGSETWIYDYQGLLLRHEDMRGHETTYTYDEVGRKLSETVARGTSQERTTRYTWDSTLEKIHTITTDYSVTTFSYDPNGQLESKTVTPVQ
jgi:YD repeat-containing protein